VFQQRTVQFLVHIDQSILQHVDRVAPLTLDYTPRLLGGYMQLFCNAIRLHMLARGMPSTLFIQLHTLLFNLVQVCRSGSLFFGFGGFVTQMLGAPWW